MTLTKTQEEMIEALKIEYPAARRTERVDARATKRDKARAKKLGVSYGDIFKAGLDALEAEIEKGE